MRCELTDDARRTCSSSSESLLREVQAMRAATSPYVIQVLGVFKGRPSTDQEVQLGLVMELMERGSLASLQVALIVF